MVEGESTGLFGTVLPPLSRSADGYINGLREANKGFLTALVFYSTRFQRFHFFANDHDVVAHQGFWDEWLEKQNLTDSKQVAVFPQEFLPASFSSDNYTLFYSGDPYLAYWIELRDAFSCQAFPIVGRVHALSQDISLGAWRSLLQAPSCALDTILCSSKASKHVVQNLLHVAGERTSCRFSGNLIDIPLGVDSVETGSSQASARNLLGLPSAGMIFLCLGRLSPVDKSDLHPLLQAIAELHNRYGIQNCYLYICGQSSESDDYVASLARLAGELGIEQQVLFNFELLADQKSLAYAAADVFVSLPDSVQESFGLTPVEAMSAGLPVVLSDWDGYRELICHGQQGYLVPTIWGDVDGLSAPTAFIDPVRAHFVQAQSVAVSQPELIDALWRLASDPILRKEMGRKGQCHFQKNFHWAGVIDRFDCIADQITQKPYPPHKPTGRLHSLHFHKAFSGYATHSLSENSLVKTTLSGRQALFHQKLSVCFDALDGVLPKSHLPALMESCLGGASVFFIRNQFKLARAQVDMAILWLLKHGLLERSTEAKIKRVDLLRRYQRRRSLSAAQGLKRLLKRVEEFQGDPTEENGALGNIDRIKPLSAQGYKGACLISFQCGETFVYRPFPSGVTQRLNHKAGLLNTFNSWLESPLFFLIPHIEECRDQYGSFSFQAFGGGVQLTPAIGMHQLGLFSAFTLMSGMSLCGNLLVICDDRLCIQDADLACHTDVVDRLYKEIAQHNFPECWESSSLAATWVDVIWDEFFAHGWVPEVAEVESVVNGFEKGMKLFSENARAWEEEINKLSFCLSRCDPVPLAQADAVIEQMQNYDLDSLGSLQELKRNLRIQARSILRQQRGDNSERVIESLVASWIQGHHYSEFRASQEGFRKKLSAIGEALQGGRAGVVSSWLAVLYRKRLLDKFGLD